MTLEEKIEVMTAFKNGEKIQVVGKLKKDWMDCDEPVWDWDSFNYRINPNSTPEGFDRAMRRIWDNKDNNAERAHIAADDLMCNLLRELGYGDGVAVFESHGKWYS